MSKALWLSNILGDSNKKQGFLSRAQVFANEHGLALTASVSDAGNEQQIKCCSGRKTTVDAGQRLLLDFRAAGGECAVKICVGSETSASGITNDKVLVLLTPSDGRQIVIAAAPSTDCLFDRKQFPAIARILKQHVLPACGVEVETKAKSPARPPRGKRPAGGALKNGG